MGLKEEMLEMKKEVEEIQEESFAMELLKDQKKQNKRQFIIILVILGMFTCLLGYTIWLLNDIGTITEETTTQEITDFDTINGNIVNKGDINGEVEEIKSKIYLNGFQERILEYRIKEYSITKMSILENCSESTINREIKKIKN